MTWLISDEARKHRAFREVWVAYLLGGLYLLLGLYTEISDQNYSVRYDAQQKWWFVQQNIRSYGATLTAFLLAVGLPRLVCCEKEYRTDKLVGRDGSDWPPVHMESENGVYSPLLRGHCFHHRRSQSAGKRRRVRVRRRPLPCCQMRVFCGYGAAADVQSCVLCAPVWLSASGRVILRRVYPDRRCADAADGAQSVPLRRKLSAVFRVFRCRV